jgi:hypothetical protein
VIILAVCAMIVVITIIATFMILHESNSRTYYDKYVTHAASIAPGAAEPDEWEAQVGPAVELYRLTQSLDEESLSADLEAEIRLELGRHLIDSGFREETLAMLERGRELGEQSLAPDHPVRQETQRLLVELGDEDLMPWEITSTDDVAPLTIVTRTTEWMKRSMHSSHKDHPLLEEMIARNKLVQNVRQASLEPGDPRLARSVIESVYLQRCKFGARDRATRAACCNMLHDFDSQRPDELGPDAALDHAAVLLKLMRMDPDPQRALDSGWAAVELVHHVHGDSFETVGALNAFETLWLDIKFAELPPSSIKSIIDRDMALWEQLREIDGISIDGSSLKGYPATTLAGQYGLNQRMDIQRDHKAGKMDISDALERLDLIEAMLNSMSIEPGHFERSFDEMYQLRGELLIREGRHAEALAFLEPLPTKASVLAQSLIVQARYTETMMDLYRSWNEADPGMGHDASMRQWTLAYAELADEVARNSAQQAEESEPGEKERLHKRERAWQENADKARASLEEDAGGD